MQIHNIKRGNIPVHINWNDTGKLKAFAVNSLTKQEIKYKIDECLN